MALTVLSAFVGGAAHAQRPGPDTIYGDDGRRNLYEVKEEKVLALADSTVALFSASSVKIDAQAGVTQLSTRHYGQSMSLCKTERFWDERNGAFCSGSLVGPDLLMTAGHCVTSESSCSNTKFVFGFGIREAGKLPETVAASDVYGCGKLIGSVVHNSGEDWALIKLDRPVAGHKPLAINRSGIENGTPLFVVGHPAGLPTKVAGGASVRNASPEGYFIANLDTFGGNSGSAVFNAKSGLVEGILVRGEVDYVWQGSCRVSNVCPDTGCRGEDVTKVSALFDKIPGPAMTLVQAPRARFAPAGKALLELLTAEEARR